MPLGAAVASGRGVLDRIANPPSVNPLAIAQGAAQAAGAVYDVKGKQADQAWGEALQQATDENGNVDYQKAQALAAHNPMATQGMLRALPITSQLTGEQQDNIKRNMTTVAQHAATLGIDPSDANVNAIVDGLKMDGMPASRAEALRTHLLSMKLPNGQPDLVQRQQFAGRAQLGAMDAVTAANRTSGAMKPEQFGGATAPTVQTQPVPGYSAGGMVVGGAIPHVGSPDVLFHYTDTNQQDQWTTSAGFQAAVAAGKVKSFLGTGTPPSGTSGGASAPPANSGTPSSPGAPSPSNPPHVAPKPKPPASSSASDLPPVAENTNLLNPPRVQVASMDANFAPAVGAPGPLAPGATNDANALLAGMRGGAVQPVAYVPPAPVTNLPPNWPGTIGGSVSGPNPSDAAKWNQSREMYNADNAASANYVSRMWPLTQALHILSDNPDVTTGAGAEAFNQVKSFLKTMSPSQSREIDATTKLDELGKYFNQIVTSNPAFGRSDMMLGTALSGSPNTHLTTMANISVAKGMLGLERMRQMALLDFKSSGADSRDWTDYLANYQTTHDPRAFLVDQLTDKQKDALANSMNGNSSAKQRERQNFAATLSQIQQHPEIWAQTAMPQ